MRGVGNQMVEVVRHFALALAALLGWIFADGLRFSNLAVGIVAAGVVINLIAALLGRRARWSAPARTLGFVGGLCSWSALAHLTGGAGSPYAAGLSLEVILSLLVGRRWAAPLVAAGGLALLVVQQVSLGFAEAAQPLSLHALLLTAAGAVGVLLGSRTDDGRREAERRLREVESELGASRSLSVVGEDAARLAHGLKNASHSLRGFLQLLPPSVGEDDAEVIAGLRSTVDRIEALARTSLEGEHRADEERTEAEELQRIAVELADDVRRRHSELTLEVQGSGCTVSVPGRVSREILEILLTNAAEATEGSGKVRLQLGREDEHLKLDVSDDGPGFGGHDPERLFEPGVTTKLEGSGFGLFLARRLCEAHGGELTAGDGPDGGALFRVRFPCSKETA